MKQIHYLFAIAIFSLCFTACNENDNTNIQWRNDNIAAYNAIKDSVGWDKLSLTDVGGPEGVYYHALVTNSVNTEHPIQTAKVKVNYRGYFFNGTNFDAGGKTEFLLTSVVRGFSVALQAMHVGDKWEICIPYYLGYGATGLVNTYTGQVLVRGYSTLFFEVELLEIEQYTK